MAYSDFDKLKAFFLELKNSNFRPEKMRSRVEMRGGWATIDRNECFNLLREKIPDLKGKDDAYLIKYLSDPRNITNRILAEFAAGERIELERSLAGEPVATEVVSGQPSGQAVPLTDQGVQPTGTATPAGLPSMPGTSIPRFSMPRRAIYTPSPSVPPQGPEPSKLVTATSSGTIKEAPEPSKLVTASSTGTIREAPPKQIFIANKSGIVTGVSNIKPPSWLKNLGSNAKIFIKTNLSRIANGLAGMAGGVGRGLGGAMSSGLGAATPSLGRAFHGGLNVVGRITQPGGLGGGGIVKPSNFGFGKKLALGALVAIFLFGLIASLSIPGTTTPSLNAAPLPSGGIPGLDYTLPLKDKSILPVNIKDQITAAFPGAKLEYWERIIQRSQSADFNPALVLALWIEETGASQATLTANGGSGIATNGALSKGHLGCAPAEDQTINESLTCLFNFVATNNFTNNQFADFMAKYSGGPANAPFSNNPDFPKNIKDWYSKLVPSGPGAIQIVSPTAIASCPVPGGQISTPSYNANQITGHCGSSYSYPCRYCPAFGDDKHSRRAKAIDVPTNNDQSVVLPKINNQNVSWKLITDSYPVDSEDGGGVGYTFQATQDGDTYYLDMLHLNSNQSLALGGNYSSGTSVATTAIPHVHMTMGKNLSSSPAPGSSTDCDPNWLASDFMCQ